MARKLSRGLRRRWSKAKRDGSLRENMAKADMRTSPRGIRISSERGRGSESESKWERSRRKRESAERSWGALPKTSALRQLQCADDKIGNPGRRNATAIYEMRIKTERP